MESTRSYEAKGIQIVPREDEAETITKNSNKSYFFALVAALGYGGANTLLAEVSSEYGVRGIYPQCIACLSIWVIFHICLFIKYKIFASVMCTKKPYEDITNAYFIPENSNYLELGIRKKPKGCIYKYFMVPI